DLRALGKTPSHHALRVGFISIIIANTLNLTKTEKMDLYLSCLVHDVGAVGIEGQLLSEENRNMINLQEHAQLGYGILSQIPFCENIALIVKDHHNASSSNLLSRIIYFADEVDVIARKQEFYNPKDLQAKVFATFKGKSQFKPILDAFLASTQTDAFLIMLNNIDEIKHFLPSYVEDRFIVLDNLKLMTLAKAIAKNFIDKKSKFTLTHSIDVAYTASSIAKNLGFADSDCDLLQTAGFLHDIGKLFVPNSILDFGGKLEGKNWLKMKSHAFYTFSFLTKLGLDKQIVSIASNHHEYLDGSGYPFGLDKTQLSIFDQIMAVADIYSALRQIRPYRQYSLDHNQALEILYGLSNKGKISKFIIDAIPSSIRLWHY
ncbi:HD-GYP domain-containing protein, partial [Desulfurella multipotens]|uniref:HD-GYP domain-containing protein n=1 Tax=Desulfurella multipotens TaxID=79269 RepID=UPI002353AC28